MKLSEFPSFKAFAEEYRRRYNQSTAEQTENIRRRLLDEGADEDSAYEQGEAFRDLRAEAREQQVELMQRWSDPSGQVH
jgi:hypothetical protein